METTLKITPKAEPVDPSGKASETVEDSKIVELTGFLGVKEPTEKDKEKVKTIAEYLKQKYPQGLSSEYMMGLRSLETRLGMPSVGETRLDKLYRYIKLDNQVKEVEKLRDSELR